MTLGAAAPPAAQAEGQGRTKGHSPSSGRPPGPARTAREASQVRRRGRGREFESRSRKGLRLPAAPAHCQPFGGPGRCQGRDQLRARPPRTPSPCARLPSARQEVGAEPGLRREGGEREGRSRNFSSGWRLGPLLESSNWRLRGGLGSFPALRAVAGGKGCSGGGARARLMVNAHRWSGHGAPRCRSRSAPAAPGQPRFSKIQRCTWWRSTGCHILISPPPPERL